GRGGRAAGHRGADGEVALDEGPLAGAAGAGRISLHRPGTAGLTRRLTGKRRVGSPVRSDEHHFFFDCCAFAQVSRRPTLRLNTSAPGWLSLLSTQKYPCRSNWKRAPAAALATDGSILQPVSVTSDVGLSWSRQSSPPGSGTFHR